MITSFFLTGFMGLARGLISLLPNPDSLPSQINDAFTSITPYISKAAFFFPLATLFTIFTIGMSIEVGILLFQAGNYLLNKIRGSG